MDENLIAHAGDTIDATRLADEYGRVAVVVGDREIIIPKKGDVKIIRKRGSIGSAFGVDVKSFLPTNAIIPVGVLQLNKISRRLTDLPDTARATLLVAPQDLANIDGKGLDTWNNSIERIRNIRGYHGLDGMEIYDHLPSSRDISYERDWAGQIKFAFAQAQLFKCRITTGLFMPTTPLMWIPENEYSGDEHTRTNLLYGSDIIEMYGGDAFIDDDSSDTDEEQPSSYFSSSEIITDPTDAAFIQFDWREPQWEKKNEVRGSTRPVALEILPDGP